MRRLTLVSVVVALGWLLTGCTHSHPVGRATPPATEGLYVAIGAGDSRGEGTDNPLRDAWTQIFFRTLPQDYAFVNLASSGATVADAVSDELPEARQLRPTLVTVSLSVNDLLAGVAANQYQVELSTLVAGLRAGGATVLLAGAPPVQTFPAYLACEDPATHPGGCPSQVARPVPSSSTIVAAVAAYNAAIASVATQQGAVVVNLDSVGGDDESQATESPFGSDGFDPNVAGAAAVAALFEQAWRHLPAATRSG